MGNHQSTNQPLPTTPTIKSNQLIYKGIFQKYSKENLISKEGLENLFQPLPKASVLFCSKNPNGLQENEFLTLLEDFDNIQNDEQQLLFYFNLVCKSLDSNDLKSEILLLIDICFNASFIMISFQHQLKSKYFEAILQILNKYNGEKELVTKYLVKNIPYLTRDLHMHLSNCLNENSPKNTVDKSNFQLMVSIESGNSLLSMEGFWIIYSFVPYSYFPFVATSLMPLMSMLIVQNAWNCLYYSNNDGLSLNRFNSIISSYNSQSLFFISFDKYLFCIGNDASWRESKDKIGGPDAFLIQLFPDYQSILAGSNLIYYNFSIKSIPRGIHIGSNSRSNILKINDDLSFVDYIGVKYNISAIEVWGCGGQNSLKNLEKQKQWEKNEALKLQNKKLNLENWEDNPDRLILNMGGIETDHNKRD